MAGEHRVAALQAGAPRHGPVGAGAAEPPPLSADACCALAPREVLARVLESLSPADVAAARRASKRMNAAVSIAVTRLRPRGLGAGLLRFPNLRELAPLKLGDAMEGATEEDLAHVGALRELRILCLARANALTSLAVLSSLSLSRLSIRRCRALPPAALAALPPSLRALDAGSCARLGDAALPALAAALTALDFSSCGLRGDGLAALAAGLTTLALLDLSSSPALLDAMLAHLAVLPRLVDLRACWCPQLRGAALACFASPPRLTALAMSATACDDVALLAVGEIVSLIRLELNDCEGVTDAGVAALGGLRELKVLYLADCPRVAGHGLLQLSQVALEDLDLSNRSLLPGVVGLSAAGVAAAGSLRALRVDARAFGDAGAQALPRMAHLTTLSARRSALTCVGAAALVVAAPALRELDLDSSTYLCAGGAAALAALPALRRISFAGCWAAGDVAMALAAHGFKPTTGGWARPRR
jgi:hypothetical protein